MFGFNNKAAFAFIHLWRVGVETKERCEKKLIATSAFMRIVAMISVAALLTSSVSSCSYFQNKPKYDISEYYCKATEVEGFFYENNNRDILRNARALSGFFSKFARCQHSFVFSRLFANSSKGPVFERNNVSVNTVSKDGAANGCVAWSPIGTIPPIRGKTCF